ncbi:GTP cyclohydrolase I FolE [Salinibacterium hongtaonis]|uniref:GTP cyclohydrolase I FolE n=1 Tax=Homoserinimonas hongtaonis TaxID=2079791 RepID=UPI000D36E611|nr:GTP cyclohydrolase I FolE [Salinibacterium hongtaonis]AWB90704.1 GTP cyclohydrolase I FolE [Salinibacterium hongtaonis]
MTETGQTAQRPDAPRIDVARIEAAVLELLKAIGEDPTRSGLEQTPRRVAQAYSEFFAGVGVDAREHLADGIDLEGNTGELVIVRDIHFRSMCEHHLLPFIGVAHLAYLPGDRIVGLGNLVRVVETLSARPQLQERLTDEIADALNDGLEARGVVVVMDASHGCVTARGSQQISSTTVTVASRGELADSVQRAAVLGLMAPTAPDFIGGRNG